jgi:hypothetical protein
MPDLDVYLRAGARAAVAEPLYRDEDSHYQFKYLPAFALLMSPISATSVPVARALWFAASVAMLVVLLLVSFRIVQAAGGSRDPSGVVQPRSRKPSWLLIALTVVILGKFYARELVLGQVNLMFAAAASAAVLAMIRGRETAAGALIAAAIVLKPYGALLVPWLLVRRQARSLGALAAGLAVALLAPAATYGLAGSLDLHRRWWNTVVTTIEPNLLNPDNVSWLAMYSRWFGAAGGLWPQALLLLTVAAALGVMAWTWACRERVAHPDGLEGALLLSLVPFLSPQGWDYVLLIATPAVMLLVAHEGRLPQELRWLTIAALAAIGLTIYDLLGRSAFHAFMNASGITLGFFPIILALATLRFRRVA